MSEFEYSTEAANTLSKFYRSDYLLYVEGDDDVLFWEKILSSCTNAKIKAETTGGSAELDKWIARIENEDLKILAARDLDFLPFCDNLNNDPRVLYTYGYSIENSLFTDECIVEISSIWCKENKTVGADYLSWIAELEAKVAALVAYDAANMKFDVGVSALGDNCARFVENAEDADLNSGKIDLHILALRQKITSEQFLEADNFIKGNGKLTRDWIRGHFLASAVLRFISYQLHSLGSSKRISHDAAFSQAIQFHRSGFSPDHPHFDHYSLQAVAAIGALKAAESLTTKAI